MNPLETLRRHVTGAIDRGEAVAVAGIPAGPEHLARSPAETLAAYGVRIIPLKSGRYQATGANGFYICAADTRAECESLAAARVDRMNARNPRGD